MFLFFRVWGYGVRIAHTAPQPTSMAPCMEGVGHAAVFLAQLIERKALNLVVVGSSPIVGANVGAARQQRVSGGPPTW